MPDKNGNFKGISVPAQAWERIFRPKNDLTEDQKRIFQAMVASMKP